MVLVHGIGVSGSCGDLLNGIPMFTYFPFGIEPKKIHGYIFIIAWPCLMGMQGHQIPLGNTSDKGNGFVGIFFLHAFEIGDKTLSAIGHIRIVLDVLLTDKFFHRAFGISRIGHLIKSNGIFLVRFQIHNGINKKMLQLRIANSIFWIKEYFKASLDILPDPLLHPQSDFD